MQNVSKLLQLTYPVGLLNGLFERSGALRSDSFSLTARLTVGS